MLVAMSTWCGGCAVLSSPDEKTLSLLLQSEIEAVTLAEEQNQNEVDSEFGSSEVDPIEIPNREPLAIKDIIGLDEDDDDEASNLEVAPFFVEDVQAPSLERENGDTIEHQDALTELSLYSDSIDGTSGAMVDLVDIPKIEMSFGEVLDSVRHDHPALKESQYEIAMARAATTTATARENPRFVVDFDTPVHDNDASELSTRLTFPLGTRRPRTLRYRAALAELDRASSNYRTVENQKLQTTLESAINALYWQRRTELDDEFASLSARRTSLLRPDLIDGDPADNTVRFVDAQLDASRATKELFSSQREMVFAQVELATSVGRVDGIRIAVLGDFDAAPIPFTSQSLPSLHELSASAVSGSSVVAAANATMQKSLHLLQIERERREDAEMGPRYQDRLGESDDTVGVRFSTNLPLHDNQRGPISEANARVLRDRQSLRLARQQVISQVTTAYADLQLARQQLQDYDQDDFIEKQEAFLAEAESSEVMTLAQMIEIQQAIVARRREELELQFRVATLLIQLGQYY